MVPYIVLVSLATAGGSPKLVAPVTPPGKDEALVLTLSTPSTLYIDGCAPLELSRHVGESWEPVTATVCPRAAAATRVDGSLTLTAPSAREGEYRAMVGWGQMCTDGVPFHLASCKKFGVARSDPFFVGTPPVAPPETPAPTPP